MKASMKFREDQKPLFRAKVPLNILGFPFQSGIVAGEPKELSLNLATFFESGPSVKFAYRPNDVTNPFSLVFKTGIGSFGSPASSALNMSAEFSYAGGSQNPSFFVHFKPQFGDFSLKKTQSSVFRKQANVVGAGGGGSDDDAPVVVDLFDSGKKFTHSPLVSPAAGVVKSVLSDVELAATTAVPLRKNARLNFRWGVRLPGTETEETTTFLMKKSNGNSNKSTAEISFQKLPVLLINKIGIEHVARGDCRGVSKISQLDGDVAEAFLGVKKQLEIIQTENGMLRKSLDNLKGEFTAVKSGTNAVKVNKNNNNNKEVIDHFGGKGGVEGEIVKVK